MQGELIGINDVGFILLPDGKRYTIAVLVKDSKESMADTEKIIDKAFRWFPMFREMLRMEKFCAMLGFSKEMTESLIVKKEALKCSGKIYSEQHRRNFDIKDDILRVENDPDDGSRLNLTINRKPQPIRPHLGNVYRT